MCENKTTATTDTSWLGATVRVKLAKGDYVVSDVLYVLPRHYGIRVSTKVKDDRFISYTTSRTVQFVKACDVHCIEKKVWDDPLPDWDVRLLGFNRAPISNSYWLEAIDEETGTYEYTGEPQSLERNVIDSRMLRWHRVKYVSLDPLPRVVWEELKERK